ncbi:hypothetical protein L218DRAFT_949560 [Marasmius fiardii PR-910]|nr:hypothetical protein L218DRAFT_949560 [Marasmius fiardii PR-910]
MLAIGRFKTTSEINNDKTERAAEIPTRSTPYTTEIHRILSPHTAYLQRVIETPSEASPTDYPSIRYQREKKQVVVDVMSGLPYSVRSEIKNWMYNVTPGLKSMPATWCTDGPLQLAYMIYIMHRDKNKFGKLKECPKKEPGRTKFIRERAWERLTTPERPKMAGNIPLIEDVDLQSLTLLEDKMFSPNFNLGDAGQQQWGLDVGIHQYNWDPYEYFPDSKGGKQYKSFNNKHSNSAT